MEQRALICIGCPLGCRLEVKMQNSQVVDVTGQSCKIGKTYAVKECTNPTRILTTTVEVENGYPEVASVKTERDIPKSKLFECIKELKGIKLAAPVHIGDVVLEDIANTGIRVVATTNCTLADN